MGLHKTKKGLSLPITGGPEQVVENASQPRHVALLAADYVGMKPTMRVSVGDDVRRGQLLFEVVDLPILRLRCGLQFFALVSFPVVGSRNTERR